MAPIHADQHSGTAVYCAVPIGTATPATRVAPIVSTASPLLPTPDRHCSTEAQLDDRIGDSAKLELVYSHILPEVSGLDVREPECAAQPNQRAVVITLSPGCLANRERGGQQVVLFA